MAKLSMGLPRTEVKVGEPATAAMARLGSFLTAANSRLPKHPLVRSLPSDQSRSRGFTSKLQRMDFLSLFLSILSLGIASRMFSRYG
jgi:hypothetical protein